MSIRMGAFLGACALVFSTACDTSTLDAELAPAITESPLTLAPNAWQVEFTNPGTSAATEVDMPIDERVIEAINAATTSVDIAVYGFDHAAITQAVLRAFSRGIRVRFVGHGDELATSNGLKAIQTAGVPMMLRPSTALMHHKFMVVDGHIVAFGSMNFTTYAAEQNDENLVFADSTELATIFKGEFEQMFAGKFGPKKIARATRPTVALDGGSVTLHFSPKEDTATRLREVLATAQTRLYFMTYSFTLAEVAADMVAAKQRGVEVVGVFDKGSATSRYSQDDFLAANGVSVYLDGNENSSGFAGGRLHDKVMIVDAGGSDPMVVTGSYNWSTGATTENDETLAILSGPRFVAPYVQEFCRIYKVSSAMATQVAPPSLCADRPLVAMTEVMANPDGVDKNEEYVEVANLGNAAADLSGWAIGDAVSATRHVFPAGTTLAPHAALVVYSGPSTTANRIVASSAQLAINNDAETMRLRNAQGVIVDQVSFGVGVSGESIHRADLGLEDLDFNGLIDGGVWGQHGALSPTGLRSSPGLRVDGSPWAATVPVEEPGHGDPGQNAIDDVIVANALPNPVGSDRPEEYVTIVNRGVVAVNLSGWSIGDITNPHRHVFGSGTTLAAGASVHIYDGGSHRDAVAASSGALSLNNDSETVTLWDASAAIVSTLSWRNAAEGAVISAP